MLPDSTLLIGGRPLPDALADEKDSIEVDSCDRVLERLLPEDAGTSLA